MKDFYIKISSCVSKNRKCKPTDSCLKRKAKEVRRKETMNACMAIHSASNDDIEPAITGMIDTLTSKCNAKYLSKKILNSKKSLVTSVKDRVINNWSKEYYKSNENVLRPLNAYYSHVLGKRKYLHIRKANIGATYDGYHVVNYVPYKELAKMINDINIGSLCNVSDLHETSEPVHGLYRNPSDYILRIAKFYLFVNQKRHDKLKIFKQFERKDTESFLFVIAVGGDGAPICGTSILLPFLNVGKRIASSDEQFLLFGADVAENSLFVSKFIRLLYNFRYQVFRKQDI